MFKTTLLTPHSTMPKEQKSLTHSPRILSLQDMRHGVQTAIRIRFLLHGLPAATGTLWCTQVSAKIHIAKPTNPAPENMRIRRVQGSTREFPSASHSFSKCPPSRCRNRCLNGFPGLQNGGISFPKRRASCFIELAVFCFR